MSTHGYYYSHSSPNYYYRNHQQRRGYNPRTANFPRRFWDQYQPPMPLYYSVDIVFPQVVNSPYGPVWIYPVLHYEQIDDVYVIDDPNDQSMGSSGMLDNINYMTSRERNSNIDFHTLRRIISSLLDDMYDYPDQEDDVSKYLKTRIHHAPAKDGVDPDANSEICVVCQSEYEDKESIGVLQCGHEYHTDCIKKWLLKKKDCPICRASVLHSQK